MISFPRQPKQRITPRRFQTSPWGLQPRAGVRQENNQQGGQSEGTLRAFHHRQGQIPDRSPARTGFKLGKVPDKILR